MNEFLQVEVENHVSAVGGVAIAVIIILTVNMLIAMYMCACGLNRLVPYTNNLLLQ